MNRIIIELCPEDRERLDKLQATMEKLSSPHPLLADGIMTVEEVRAAYQGCPVGDQGPEGEAGDPGTGIGPVGPKGPKGAATEPDVNIPGQQAIPEVAEPVEPASEEPEVTTAMLQKKVVSLSAAGRKKEVREIVTAYAEKVSDIPEAKRREVWDKLSELG